MSKQPFMPLFFGDFLASTAEWSGEERGLYLLLLGHQWSLGSLPSNPRRLCRLVDWEPDLFDDCWTMVGTKFNEVDGRLYNRRLEEHREKARAISAKNKANGLLGSDKRWDKNGERHGSANGESEASAIDQPMAVGEQIANATTHSIPILPTPSDSEPKAPVDTLELEVGVQGEEPSPPASRDTREPEPQTKVREGSLRRVEVPESLRKGAKSRGRSTASPAP